MGDQSCAKPGEALSGFGRVAGCFKAGGAGIGGPVRRRQTLNAAAFLIDKNGRVSSKRSAYFLRQSRDLFGALDIAPK